MSRVVGGKESSGPTKWKVGSFPLPYLFAIWSINPEKDKVFLKVDVESHECELVPSWVDWMATLRRKPTVYLSLHSHVRLCTDEQYAQITRFIRLFKSYTPGIIQNEQLAVKSGRIFLSDVYQA